MNTPTREVVIKKAEWVWLLAETNAWTEKYERAKVRLATMVSNYCNNTLDDTNSREADDLRVEVNNIIWVDLDT